MTNRTTNQTLQNFEPANADIPVYTKPSPRAAQRPATPRGAGAMTSQEPAGALATNAEPTTRRDTGRDTDLCSGGGEPIELHWMTQPNLDMAAFGISAVTLCGLWISPDEELAGEVTGGRNMSRYVSCAMCDRLHAGAAS